MRVSNVLPFVLGSACMFVALALENITFTEPSEYAPALRQALIFAAAADLLFLLAAWRGGSHWRIAACAAMLPTVWIIAEFVRRASFVF
jgi:hypothetical protein